MKLQGSRKMNIMMMSAAAGICAGALALQGCTAERPTAEQPTGVRSIEDVADAMRDANDLRRTEVFAEEFETWEASSGHPATTGRRVKAADYAKHITLEHEIWLKALPDYRREETKVRIVGDEVIVTTTMVATGKDGETFVTPICVIYTVENGEVVRKHTYVNTSRGTGFRDALIEANFVSPMRRDDAS